MVKELKFFVFLVYLIALNSFASVNIILAWDKPSDTNIIGYNIYYGVSSRVYTNRIDVGNTNQGKVPDLKNGVRYYFAATAYNIIGMESDYSSEISYDVPLVIPTNIVYIGTEFRWWRNLTNINKTNIQLKIFTNPPNYFYRQFLVISNRPFFGQGLSNHTYVGTRLEWYRQLTNIQSANFGLMSFTNPVPFVSQSLIITNNPVSR